MYRSVEDFLESWAYETEATLKVFRALTPESLGQRVSPDGRTLGALAWHIVLSQPHMMTCAGVPAAGPATDAPRPALAEIVRQYELCARAVCEGVRQNWTDAMLPEAIPVFGERWPRGKVLFSLVTHQTHHRAQMTVLMRQAGLKVPGVYGPAREEWAAMNMPAQP